MHEEEPTKYVTFERFEVRALEMLREGKYAPDTEEMLLAAFKVSTRRYGLRTTRWQRARTPRGNPRPPGASLIAGL